ncbi:MAG: Zn-ribbon domain-containing OB-fold protein [archaeon]
MIQNLALTWRRIPERYTLKGNYCKTCGNVFFPPKKICPRCRRKGVLEEKTFSGKGKIYSYTVVRSPPAGFELEAPYVLGIIELEEGPKITSQIVDSPLEKITIGAPVSVVFRKIQEDGKEGVIHYGYKFKVQT